MRIAEANRPLRIALYHNLPSGGAMRALCEIVRRLDDWHTVDLFTLTSAESNFCDMAPFIGEIHSYPFEPLPGLRRPFGRLNQGLRVVDMRRLDRLQQTIAADIDAAHYDAVLVNHCQFTQAPLLMRHLKTPCVYFCQEPPRHLYEHPIPRPSNQLSRLQKLGNLIDPLPGWYRRTLTRLDRESARQAQVVGTNSEYSRESLSRAYDMFARAVRDGIDAQRFRPLDLPREHAVLSVGSLNTRKGFDFLIESLALIEASARPRFHIVSNAADSAEFAYLNQLASDRGVDICWHSRISDEELVTLYNRVKATLYAPIMEPLGFVPLESMACATPVVGVREAGVRETITHGETGLLTERDPLDFAIALQTLIANPDLADCLGQKGRLTVERDWRWETCAANIEGWLSAVASTP